MPRNWFLGLPYDAVGIMLSICFLTIAELIRRNAKHRELAYQDQLTQALNRRAGNVLLAEHERRKRRRQFRKKEWRLCLIMVDVDHFKKVNDTYGHEAGDAVLKEVVRLLQSCCRGLDQVFRLGGEEFGVSLPGVTQAVALGIAERMRAALDTTLDYKGTPIPITASFGVAICQLNVPVDESLRAADKALYEAKKAGRNCVRMAA